MHAFLYAIVHNGGGVFGRYHDNGKIDFARDICDSRISHHRSNNSSVLVHRIDDSLKTGGDEVVKNLSADSSALAPRAYDGNRLRLEERLHRRSRRHLRTKRSFLFVLRGWSDREGYLKDSAVKPAFDREARVHEHIHHLAIVAEHISVESRYALFSSDLGQAFEHAGGYAAALQRVFYEKSDFGAVVGFLIAVIACYADEPPGKLAYQGERIVVVYAGKHLCSLLAQLR